MFKKIKTGFFLLFVSLQSLAQHQISLDGTSVSRLQSIRLESASRPGFAAAVPLEQQDLVLEFDDLWETREDYYARLVHCNADWSVSRLRDLDFLDQYNEGNVNDYAYSSNTHVPYVHYRYAVPEVRMPGNYLLEIYPDGNKSKVVLRRRFLVFRQETTISPIRRPGANVLRKDLQEISFSVQYPTEEITDPARNITVVVRQNHRWDNALPLPAPSRIDQIRGILEYMYYDQRSAIAAGNEYRFVNFTSLNYLGINTGPLDRTRKPFHLYVGLDKPRSGQVYEQYRDLNGAWIPEDRDGGNVATTGQYLWVHFTLLNPPSSQREIFVAGNWSDHAAAPAYLMKPFQDGLTCSVLLKQGLYNYQYITAPGKTLPERLNPVEGDYTETENVYEILIYHRQFSTGADQLIGYEQLRLNPR